MTSQVACTRRSAGCPCSCSTTNCLLNSEAQFHDCCYSITVKFSIFAVNSFRDDTCWEFGTVPTCSRQEPQCQVPSGRQLSCYRFFKTALRNSSCVAYHGNYAIYILLSLLCLLLQINLPDFDFNYTYPAIPNSNSRYSLLIAIYFAP